MVTQNNVEVLSCSGVSKIFLTPFKKWLGIKTIHFHFFIFQKKFVKNEFPTLF